MRIELSPGTVGYCDVCTRGPLPLHAVDTGKALCSVCATFAVSNFTAAWVESLEATLDATIQILEGSPLDTPVDAPHALTADNVTIPQAPTFTIGPDGNRWAIADEITASGVPCPDCGDTRSKRGHALVSPQNAPWIHIQCGSCHVYLWLPLLPKNPPKGAVPS